MCTPSGLSCHHASTTSPCPVACEGLYADVSFSSQAENQKDQHKFSLLRDEYQMYKDRWAPNIQYNPGAGAKKNYSEFQANKDIYNFYPQQ